MKPLSNNQQLSIDDIVDKVLFQTYNNDKYNYTKTQNHHNISQEHLKHYQLQQQNLSLQSQLKILKNKIKAKINTQQKHSKIDKQIQELKAQLQTIISNNTDLQNQINKIRNKHTQINQTITNSLDRSFQKRKTTRQCLCQDHPHQLSTHQHKINLKNNKIYSNSSPNKSSLKTTRELSISCHFPTPNHYTQQISNKKDYILSLKNILNNQQQLITAYQKELNVKNQNTIIDKKQTMASTHRFQPIERFTSQTTFKPASSAGSIVKIRRK